MSCVIYMLNSDLLRTFLHSEHLGHPHLWTDDGTNLWYRNDFQVMTFQSLLFNDFLYQIPNLTHTERQRSHGSMRHLMSMKLTCYWGLFHIQSTKVSPGWIHLFILLELGLEAKPSCCIWKASLPSEFDGAHSVVYLPKLFSSLDIP